MFVLIKIKCSHKAVVLNICDEFSLLMVDEQTKEDLLKELEEIEQQLDGLDDSKESTPVHPFLFSSLHFFTGMLFLLLFFITVSSNLPALKLVAAGSFIIAALALIRVLADITRKKLTGFLLFLFLGLLLAVGVSYYLLWTQVLQSVTWLVFSILLIVFAIEVFFYLLHTYIGFFKRKASYEAKATGVILLLSLVIILATFLYSHALLYLLFFIAVCVFAKANLDFAESLREKNNNKK